MYRYKRLLKLMPVLLLGVMLAACGDDKSQALTESSSGSFEDTEYEDEETATEESFLEYVPNDNMLSRPFVILSVDTTTQQMMLREPESGRQFLYHYNLGTQFLDKYGGLISVADFFPGRVAVLEGMNERGLIASVRLSDEVWEFDKITNYEIDAGRGVFTIGVTNYRIPEDVLVFSDGFEIGIEGIGENDELRLTGEDKDIWAIAVTTGHGTINLINTDAFDGSLICVGNVYGLINGPMSMEVPEGTYNVTVANKGYGGSAAVEVVRGGSVTLDLNTIKGSGEPKYCKLTFNIEVEDADIKIDGMKVNAGEALDVEYGKHRLTVSAPGYEKWTKTLYVNSETATILLEMDEETKGSSSNKTDTTGSDSSSSGGDDKDSSNGNSGSSSESSNNSSGSDEKSKDEVELEYLTTIRDTVSNIMNSINL